MAGPDFQVQRSGDTLNVAGRLDFTTATRALEQVSELIRSSNAHQTIDMGGITSSNSAGLAVMIEWLAIAQQTDQSISFENIPDSLRQISTVCQVDSLI